jgi:stage V sporulation protein D (sporulation-specific penicillin-binding protein)
MKARAANNETILRMLLIMAVMLLVIVPVLIYKMYTIQVRDAADLQSKAIAQQTRDMLISPVRGSIYDRNMLPLAISASVNTIVVSPAEIKDEAEAVLIAQGLSDILGLEYDQVYKRTTNKKSYYEIIARKVEKDISDQVRAFKTEHRLAGIKLFEDTKRYYPYSNLASNVIGFTNYDNEGQYGLELRFESVLEGVVGRIITAKNNKGSEMPFYFEQYFDAQDGKSLVLTLDYGVQQILEKQLEIAWEENGCKEGVRGIVMDVKTGGILAMAQKGDYDLNNPRTIADQEKAAEIEAAPEDQREALRLQYMMEQWANRPIQEPYEPGSVFKILTAAIGMEEGKVGLNSHFSCGGSHKVGDRTIHCWKRIGHGSQTFAEALQNSCNIAFMRIGAATGNKTFYEYFQAFGLTEKTGVDMLGEIAPKRGIHYHTYQTFTDSRFGAEVTLATYSFGQTFKITPIQMITAVSAVVNGGNLMRPYVVQALADENGNIVEEYSPTVVRQVISAQTSNTMRELLEGVVSKGTGKNAYVPGYRVGGKTGTSEKRDKEVALGGKYYIASFLGIAPMDDPQVAVLVLLDEPSGALHQGGQIAAPVVGRIMAELMPYLNVQPIYSDTDLARLAMEVPLTVGGDKDWAQYILKQQGFTNVEVRGSGDKVTSQFPRSGSKIPTNSKVILYCGIEPEKNLVKVPDLTGKTYEQATKILTNRGLYISPGGALGAQTDEILTVKRQSPAKDTEVTVGTVVTAEFYGSAEVGE